MSRPITMIVAGAGGRGHGYGTIAKRYPERIGIVGVAEPRDFYRERMREEHAIPAGNVFRDWRDMARRDRFADAVLVATQDAMHEAPAVAFASKGYAMLLEKPMAPTEAACRAIVKAAQANRILFAVCHVMRYTLYTRKLKELVSSGAVGEVMSLQHLEPVGYWHQAHSFVRGNWRREDESSCMLLAKSCHDLDWIRYMINDRCAAVSSFGELSHFRREQRPPDAADRCLDCPREPRCPYSAAKIYIGRVRHGHTGWPVNVLTPDVTEAGVLKALREGPYGRCVYACDNDVVDHQVVNMRFARGQTATFTMTAFCMSGDRKTHIFGTHGELRGTGDKIEHRDFLTDQTRVYGMEEFGGTVDSGHGGGDSRLFDAFVEAVATNNQGLLLSGAEETLESHLMVFAAERARRENRVVTL